MLKISGLEAFLNVKCHQIPIYLCKSLSVQRRGGYPIPGDTQCQAGWDSEQPDLAVDAPVHCRRVGPDAL